MSPMRKPSSKRALELARCNQLVSDKADFTSESACVLVLSTTATGTEKTVEHTPSHLLNDSQGFGPTPQASTRKDLTSSNIIPGWAYSLTSSTQFLWEFLPHLLFHSLIPLPVSAKKQPPTTFKDTDRHVRIITNYI